MTIPPLKAPFAKPIIFIDGTTRLDALFGKWEKRFTIFAIAIFIIAFSALFFMGVPKLRDDFNGWLHVSGPIIVLIGQAGRFWQGKRKSLTFDAAGIHYRSGLPAFMQRWDKDWNADWESIKRIDWQSSKNRSSSGLLPLVRIELETIETRHTILASVWADTDDVAAWRQARKKIRPRTEWPNKFITPSAADWADLPIVRAFSKTRFPLSDYTLFSQQFAGFDLMKNSASRYAVWGFFGALAYVMFELFINRFQWLPKTPWHGFAGVAILMLVVCLTTLKKKRVPWGESVVLSMLIAPCVAATCLFFILRINGWSDFHPVSAEYVLQKDGRLHSANAQLPELYFPENFEYWSSQKMNSTHYFKLYRGLFGFYQLDVDDYRTQLRPFYEKRYGK